MSSSAACYCNSLFVVRLPSIDKSSISSIARVKTSDEIFCQLPAYAHWFGLSMYNLRCQLQKEINGESNEIEVKFRGVSYKFERSFLKEINDHVRISAKRHKYPLHDFGVNNSPGLIQSEMIYSALYATFLGDLCNCLSQSCAIVHQVPVRKMNNKPGNPEVADIAGISKTDKRIVFMSDIKLCDIFVAEKETALYGKYASINKDRDPKRCNLVFGLASTKHTASLWLYLMGDGLQWSLCIDDHIDPWSMDLLALISVVSVSLSSNPVEYSVLKDPVPFQEEMRAMKVGPKCRVFLDKKKNQIIKLFCRSEGFLFFT